MILIGSDNQFLILPIRTFKNYSTNQNKVYKHRCLLFCQKLSDCFKNEGFIFSELVVGSQKKYKNFHLRVFTDNVDKLTYFDPLPSFIDSFYLVKIDIYEFFL